MLFFNLQPGNPIYVLYNNGLNYASCAIIRYLALSYSGKDRVMNSLPQLATEFLMINQPNSLKLDNSTSQSKFPLMAIKKTIHWQTHQYIESPTKGHVLLFIPGYNTTLKQAIKIATLLGQQIAQISGKVFDVWVFSWPSMVQLVRIATFFHLIWFFCFIVLLQGKFIGYPFDAKMIQQCNKHFKKFLKNLYGNYGYSFIDIIAHSMGSRFAFALFFLFLCSQYQYLLNFTLNTDDLRSNDFIRLVLNTLAGPSKKSKFDWSKISHIVFGAPDVDTHEFESQFKRISQSLDKANEKIMLMQNSKDAALIVILVLHFDRDYVLYATWFRISDPFLSHNWSSIAIPIHLYGTENRSKHHS